MVDRREGKTMNWIGRYRASGEAEPAAPWHETAIANMRYDARNAPWSSPENAPAPSESRGSEIPEDIKRRQVSVALRYVMAVRAR
ncbi:MAG: hypothetical protein KGJ99_06290 [Betaproteobacteria bacterium]|nr:hypothetical protein [Betaproteobacteria bacterium]MDE2209314.1 hypothetical protein [Betaproteobacteria bacterium]